MPNFTKPRFQNLLLSAFAVGSLSCIVACKNTTPPKAGVVAHILAEPVQFTQFNQDDGISRKINEYLFQALTTIDHKTGDYAPLLLKALPKLVPIEGGKLRMEMEIRAAATWDDGSPITADDVAFSLKVIRTPQTDCKKTKPYFEKIENIEIDAQNPKKFALIYSENDAYADAALTDLVVLPQKVYDKAGILKNYTLAAMVAAGDALKEDAKLNEFGTQYNGVHFQREEIVGSGAYRFAKWETNKRVVLERKTKWWGDALHETPEYEQYSWLHAAPKQLTFELIADLQNAVTVLKSGKLDVMSAIPAKAFLEDFDENFKKKYATLTPNRPVYFYIGMHTRNPKLSDAKTRQAISYLFDKNSFIKTAYQGLATPVNTYMGLHLKKFINPNLNHYDFSIEKAKTLLAEAGWKDSNNNGVVDKMINGKNTELNLAFLIRSKSVPAEKGALILQEAAQKAGVKIEIVVVESNILTERLGKHDFELVFSGLGSPVESDPNQIWGSESYLGGMNYTGFGNAASDDIIKKIRSELNPEKRIALHHALQKEINDQAPMIFVVSPKNTLAINKAYGEISTSKQEPGYWLGSLGAGVAANVAE
jgi:peptide/nickel transport system substrate-binding protein